MTQSERWTEHKPSDGEWLRVDFGALSIIVLNYRSEWRIASFRDGAPEGLADSGTVDSLPDDLKWERWDHHEDDVRLRFQPVFPPMPVVARPHFPLHIRPKGQAGFFIGVAAWIEVIGECRDEMLPLTALPTATLSKTWHGTPLAGRLGYALRTYARRVFEPEEWPQMDIVCPISLLNDGGASMPFERLYLETGHLSVFEKDGRLWSNAARIRMGGDAGDLGNVTYAPRPSAPYNDAVEITPPRMGRIRRSTIQSAFARVLGHINPFDDPS
jgi:hypothetical protein